MEAFYKALIQGITTELVGIDSFVLDGQTIGRADLLGRFQARIDAAQTVKSNRAVLQQSIAGERAIDASVKPLRNSMKSYLESRYGKLSPKLQAFGFTQTRKGKPTAKTKAGAVVKAKATRVARGTKGKQQKRAVAPSAAVPTPAVSAPSTGTPASPAPTVTPAGSARS